MKLVSFERDNADHLAILKDNKLYPLQSLDPSMPGTMSRFLQAGERAMDKAKRYEQMIEEGNIDTEPYIFDREKILAPLPNPKSCRDAYAFRQHVSTARANRGLDMIPEFDQFPVFYFTNHNAIYGPGEIPLMPDHFQKLDYELEIAIVTNKEGRNISAENADNYIAGYMLMNDISARQLQMEEMKLNLGPAKGKDFASSFGPWLVTPDELLPWQTAPKEGHTGHNFNLSMKAYINDEKYSEGNFADIDWTFAEILERISYGVDIFPGEIIGSGTVGTGCLLELNGTGKRQNPDHEPRWLTEKDTVTLEATGLGKLTNTFKMVDQDYSLLDLKKRIDH